MIVLKVLCIMVAITLSYGKTSSRAIEGYPVGFMAYCPGSNKEARISQQSRRKLEFVVYPDSNNSKILNSLKNAMAFDYFHMENLRKYLNFNKKTVLYVTEYIDTKYISVRSVSMGTAYKSLGYNFLTLESAAFTTQVFPRAARLIRPIGKHAAEMLAELTKYGLDPKKLELVGIGLGGQTISYIAKNYRRITGMNISRITGLDPAGACFRRNGPDDRIDASDADFVDIIHTNSDVFGIAGAVGHVDYYINGGEYQPNGIEELPCTSFCSHGRASTLWIGALLNPNTIIGLQCDSIQDARDRNCFERKPLVTNVLGLDVDKTKQGTFYVMSSNIFPFYMREKGLKRKNDIVNHVIEGFNDVDILEI